MTDANDSQPQPTGAQARKPPDRRPTLGSRPGFWPTAVLAGASFLLLFEFLAFQLSHGNDPALGGAAVSTPSKPPRPVLVRRVVNTRVIADGGTGDGTTVSSGSASSGASASSSGSTSSSAPAAASAPAPAAPVVSSSS